ncbi:MAG: leucine-rich repeat domain-containing protein [Eubacterium sp.]|nr:leucine-rich repeat domain-containing protein [Eubacterium sp.]
MKIVSVKRAAMLVAAACVMVLMAAAVLADPVYADGGVVLQHGGTGDCEYVLGEDSNGVCYLKVTGNEYGGKMKNYELDDKGVSTAPWMNYKDEIEQVIFTDVTEIGDFAFCDCTAIGEVNVKGIRRIGRRAFYGCRGIKHIEVKGGLDCYIDMEAFAECDDLGGKVMDYIKLENVHRIYEEAFYEDECNELELGEGLVSIGPAAFSLNETVRMVEIPKSCEYIHKNAFIHCTNLAEAFIKSPGCEIDEDAFDKRYNTTLYVRDHSTALDYAMQYGFDYVIFGNLGVYTVDLKDGPAVIDMSNPTNEQYALLLTLNVMTYSELVGAERVSDQVWYIDLDNDGNWDLELDYGAVAGVVIRPHASRSVLNWSFEMTDEMIEEGYDAVSVFYDTLEFEMPKFDNPIKVKTKTASVKYSKLRKKNQTISRSKIFTISGAQGSLTFKKTKGSKKITINRSTGKVTVKKGLAKGKYKVTVKVTAAGDDIYASGSKTKTFTIRVK